MDQTWHGNRWLLFRRKWSKYYRGEKGMQQIRIGWANWSVYCKRREIRANDQSHLVWVRIAWDRSFWCCEDVLADWRMRPKIRTWSARLGQNECSFSSARLSQCLTFSTQITTMFLTCIDQIPISLLQCCESMSNDVFSILCVVLIEWFTKRRRGTSFTLATTSNEFPLPLGFTRRANVCVQFLQMMCDTFFGTFLAFLSVFSPRSTALPLIPTLRTLELAKTRGRFS